MKKLILLLLICSTIVSCTYMESANTLVDCPCTVVQNEIRKDGRYYMRVKSLSEETYFSFYTTTQHQLGDTIQ